MKTPTHIANVDLKMPSIVCILWAFGMLTLLIWFNKPNAVQAQTGVNATQAQINFSSSGDNTVLAASTCAKSTRIVKMWFVNTDGTTATNIIFKDGSTALNPAARFASGGSFYGQFDDKVPWIITTAGHALVFNSSAAVQVSGEIWYICTNA